MAIKVRILGDLSRFTTDDTAEMDGSGWTIGTAIDELVRRNPGLHEAMFDTQGRLHYAIFIRNGGRPAAWPGDKDAPVQDDEVLLLTRFHSGG